MIDVDVMRANVTQVLRDAIAALDDERARYAAALAALDEPELVTAPSPDLPTPPARLPARKKPATHRCDECDREFVNAAGLGAHRRKHRLDAERADNDTHGGSGSARRDEATKTGTATGKAKGDREHWPHPRKRLADIPDDEPIQGPWTTEPIERSGVDEDAARNAAGAAL